MSDSISGSSLRDYSKYIGLPYKLYGRDIVRDGGLDCYGLVFHILKNELGVDVKAYESIYYAPTNERLTASGIMDVANNSGDWRLIPRAEMREGDVIVFRMKGLPIHLGYAINKHSFIHVYQGINSVVEHLTSIKWEKRIYAVYRLRGI